MGTSILSDPRRGQARREARRREWEELLERLKRENPKKKAVTLLADLKGVSESLVYAVLAGER